MAHERPGTGTIIVTDGEDAYTHGRYSQHFARLAAITQSRTYSVRISCYTNGGSYDIKTGKQLGNIGIHVSVVLL